MQRITILLFVAICLISSAYGQHSYQTYGAEDHETGYREMTDHERKLFLMVMIGTAAAQLAIVWLCCLWCAASPASRCCCPHRKNIYMEGVIIQADNRGQPNCSSADLPLHQL